MHVQKYCFSLAKMQICWVFVAVFVVVALSSLICTCQPSHLRNFP